MSKKIILGLLIALMVILAVSCVRHVKYLSNVGHREGYENPGITCTKCHGSDLKGDDDTPSCYECHGKNWQ